MKIGIISDIHANSVALDAVLENIKQENIDELFCLGDIATLGPDPFSVTDRLLNLECSFILGNHDEFLFNNKALEKYIKIPITVQGIEWAKNQLTDSQIDTIKNFERKILLRLHNKKILFVHGSPDSNTEDILSYTDPAAIDNVIANSDADIIVSGHTHIQMLRQHKGILIINPGSVGCPVKEYTAGRQPDIMRFAEYAIIEILSNDNVNVLLKRVSLDQSELLKMARNCDNPMRNIFIDVYS